MKSKAMLEVNMAEIQRHLRKLINTVVNYDSEVTQPKSQGVSVPVSKQTAYADQFGIAARALTQFLYDAPRGDDISAASFFGTAAEQAAWDAKRGQCPQLLKQYRRDTDKQVAHPTEAGAKMPATRRRVDSKQIVETIMNCLEALKNETAAHGIIRFDPMDPSDQITPAGAQCARNVSVDIGST